MVGQPVWEGTEVQRRTMHSPFQTAKSTGAGGQQLKVPTGSDQIVGFNQQWQPVKPNPVVFQPVHPLHGQRVIVQQYASLPTETQQRYATASQPQTRMQPVSYQYPAQAQNMHYTSAPTYVYSAQGAPVQYQPTVYPPNGMQMIHLPSSQATAQPFIRSKFSGLNQPFVASNPNNAVNPVWPQQQQQLQQQQWHHSGHQQQQQLPQPHYPASTQGSYQHRPLKRKSPYQPGRRRDRSQYDAPQGRPQKRMNVNKRDSKRFEGTHRDRPARSKRRDDELPAKYTSLVYAFGSSAEEVAEWLKQRKARFPTQSRIEENLKLQQQLEEETSKECNETVVSKSVTRPVSRKPPRQQSMGRRDTVRVCIKYLNGVCPFGESCKYSHDPERRAGILAKRRENIRQKRSIDLEKALSHQKDKHLSLQETLIMTERDKESFLLVACVKYICENGFFDTPSENCESSKDTSSS